ncbi:hypothetical protein TIFTF001_025726 [Ficus carica]|uniref:Uncharacterized protein n=1 Tax=Ficus carica TaxID=3494 RepID=A0AA88AX62_FICCA|nr:hypothetical protein TIFTF001_025726 [Ficus carica]
MESGYSVIKSGKHNGDNVPRANLPSSIASSEKILSRSNAQKLNNFYSGDDETIDARAASYISYVQERFRLETVV